MYLSPVIIIATILGGISFYIAFKSLRKFGWFFAWLRGSFGLLFLVFSICVLWAAYDLTHYDELLEERPIASVAFDKIEEQKYLATVSYYIDKAPVEFEVYGDQWQIDARIIRWTGFLSALGAKPGFRLDRLSGRYYSLEDERNKPRSVYALNEQPSHQFDMWKIISAHGVLLPGIDASYGSAAFLPMEDAASFELSLSYSGLTAKPVNKIAQDAVSRWK